MDRLEKSVPPAFFPMDGDDSKEKREGGREGPLPRPSSAIQIMTMAVHTW